MANITPTAINNAGNELAWTASTPAGDVVIYRGGTLVVEFQNGHSASIEVSVAPTRTTAKVEGVGDVTVPTRSLALAAGEPGIFVFKPDEIAAYRNAAGNIPIAYASGNAALTVRSFIIN